MSDGLDYRATPKGSSPEPDRGLDGSGSGRFVLVETLASKHLGRTLWFQQMTFVGPMTTNKRAEAYEFASEESARRSPPMFHSLSFFEPVPADAVGEPHPSDSRPSPSNEPGPEGS